ncbi:DUF1643 domain-containing protein [Planctomicrobium sp. SH661]|uniref:DUF1643 domain-containing protein n=1 Tax=Planctomicrobium sp. SH661 TaxID=3448124 RepID=UPI003F5B54A9
MEALVSARHVCDDVFSQATYSSCRRYRFSLVRRFGKPVAKKHERIAFIGLNPSTATEQVNDPTVRRCIGYAQLWGYREFVMLNAFGYRSTDPRGLQTIEDPVGAANNEQIRYWSRRSDVVVCCWGVHAVLQDRGAYLEEQLRKWNVTARCLGKTLAGFPKHPLYLRKDADLIEL